MKLIACIDEDTLGIGKDGKLLYHISEDMQMFKALTLGCHVIMGRETLNSLPNQSLDNRLKLVLTHHSETCHSYDEDLIRRHVYFKSVEELMFYMSTSLAHYQAFVVGGESIYRQFLPYCDYAFLTLVKSINNDSPEADRFFPEEIWKETDVWKTIYHSEKRFSTDGKFYYTFLVCKRINNDAEDAYKKLIGKY